MSKRMLVNAAQAGEIRVAIVDNNVLEDLNVASEGNEQIKGNVYRARVVSVESGLQAAFVDYGAERNGFITFNDIDKRFWTRKPRGEGRPRIQDCIDRGAELLVQAYKEEMGNKGAALTTDITLPGRYLVIMPFSGSGGVSRKIEDEEARKKLKDLIKKLNPPEEMGIIVRTAGVGASRQELEGDYQNLVRVWAHIHHQFEQKAEPGLIYQEQDVVIRSVRDYFTDDIDEVVADNPRVHQRVLEFFQRNMPGAAAKVKLYAGKMPIFSNYGLERQLENIVSPRVPLKSGGYIIINPTEALTAIDVNSGKSKGQDNQEQMAFQTNQEAAEEVARQLRLRDLGGLIVVDFIDMEDARNRREVERVLKKGMKLDKARVEIGRVSRFGLLELSRQRIKARLLSTTHKLCPTCEGSGYVLGTETSGLSMLRRLQELAVSAQEGSTIRGRLGVDVALFLLNKQREALAELEAQFKVTIEVLPDATAIANRESFEVIRAGGAEKAPEERRDRGDKRSRDRERERDRADKRNPKAKLPQLPRLQAPKTLDEATGDEEADDDSPFEPPRIVGYVAPEKLVADAPSTDAAEAEAEGDDEGEGEGDASDSGERDGRRRRRRRKGRGRGEGETSTTATTPTPPSRPTPPPAVIAAKAPAAEDDAADDEDEEGDEAEGDDTAVAGEDGEARRRRRRRRRRKGRGGEAQAPQPGTAEEPAVAAAPVAPAAPTAPSAPADADQARREDARARNRARREGRGEREHRHEGAVARVLETLGETVSTPVEAPVAAPVAVTPPSEPAVAGRVKDRLRQKAGLAPAPKAETSVVAAPVAAAPVAAPEPVVVAAPVAPAPPPEQVAGRVKDRLRQKAGLAPAPKAETPVVAAPVAAPEPVVEAAPVAPAPPPEQVAGRVKDRLRQKAGLAPAPKAETPVAAAPVVTAPEPVVEAAPVAPPPPPEQVAGRVKDRLRQKAGLAPAPKAETPAVAAPAAPVAKADAPHDRVKDRLRSRRGDAPVAPPTVVEAVEPEAVEPEVEVVETAPPAPPPEQVASRVKDRLRKKAGLEATPAAQPAPAPKAPAPVAAEPVAAQPAPAPAGDAKSRLKDKLKARTADAPAAPAAPTPAPKAAESAPAPKAAEPAAAESAPAPKGRRGKRSGSEAAASVLATLGE
jgi:ribonuclease E